MKRFIPILLAVAVIFGSCSEQIATPTMFAHRGCWSKSDTGEFIIPENSVAAVAMAARMGYAGIECDVHLTKDGQMVILHDKTINRTLRRAADYSKVEEPILLADLTFEQIRNEYVMESTIPELRRAIPTLEEILLECKRVGMIPMLHSALPESYEVAQQMFGNDWICFTADYEKILGVRSYSDCLALYSINEGTAEQIIPKLEQIGGRCGVSSMRDHIYTPEFCKALTDEGYKIQASIFKSPKEVVAQRNGVTYQLSDFSIMPTHKPIAKWRTKVGGIYSLPREIECGAVLTEVEYCGTIKVTINNRVYNLTRETMGRDIIGNRFFDRSPQVEIVTDDGELKSATTKVFEY